MKNKKLTQQEKITADMDDEIALLYERIIVKDKSLSLSIQRQSMEILMSLTIN